MTVTTKRAVWCRVWRAFWAAIRAAVADARHPPPTSPS